MKPPMWIRDALWLAASLAMVAVLGLAAGGLSR